MALQGKRHCSPEKNFVALMVLVNIKTDSFFLLAQQALAISFKSQAHRLVWQKRNLSSPPQERETLPWMLLRMNGWLPFKPGGVLFSVFLHPHHTNWELFVLLLIFSTQDHSTVGVQPFQTAHKLCLTADGIYLLSLLLERPHLERWP